MCNPSVRSDDSHRYGEKLYQHRLFPQWFKTFKEDQRRSANLIWERIFDKCGTDPDLPPITHVIDYGCGEGTFLAHLVKAFKQTKKAKRCTPEINFLGLDCCATTVALAKRRHARSGLVITSCDPCPKNALLNISVPWRSTAFIILGHSWFHFDQECLIKTLVRLRPAMILVDVHATWDDAIERLRKGHGPEMEYGRACNNEKTYWLRSESNGAKIFRGLYWTGRNGGEGWAFKTEQCPKTTDELFGGLRSLSERMSPETVLARARTSGDFVEHSVAETVCAYVHVRQYSHSAGWGPMVCHVLVSLDPISRMLNRAWLQTIASLITEVVSSDTETGAPSIKRMLKLFDDPARLTKRSIAARQMPGSREALVLLPFDQNVTFAGIVSLFGAQNDIGKFPLLVEHPTRWQTQFPSANGVFQTCLARSSGAQAFPTGWAHDYDLTPADKAIAKLELKVLGLDRDGKWPGEGDPASYFMVPFYFGSLPLFCLALKFPQHFAPETTGFDVFQSTIKSLHDAAHTRLTDDAVRLRIVRPWIEACLSAERPSDQASASVDERLNEIEERLFGMSESTEAHGILPAYELRSQIRRGGVLAKEWKSWILGLPSFPIKKMAAVIEQNNRLWDIWKRERAIACYDSALRISLWFQDGGFFESSAGGESAHDDWYCAVHLDRLRWMFSNLGCTVDSAGGVDDQWLGNAVAWLSGSSDGRNRFFGIRTTQHFLFHWMCIQLRELVSAKAGCAAKTDCVHPNPPACPRSRGPFQALKAVFCRTLANTGERMRFSLPRLYHMLDAARLINGEPKGAIDPASVTDLNSMYYLPDAFKSKFWSDEDPTALLSEFVHVLAKMKTDGRQVSVLQEVKILEASSDSCCAPAKVKIKLGLKLNPRRGGDESKRLEALRGRMKEMGLSVSDVCGKSCIDISFCMKSDGTIQKPNH